MIELAAGEEPGQYDLDFAGDSYNTAIYLARAGLDVGYVTRLGDDALIRASDGESWLLSARPDVADAERERDDAARRAELEARLAERVERLVLLGGRDAVPAADAEHADLLDDLGYSGSEEPEADGSADRVDPDSR